MAWSIDASILNILWADLWPRLMAQGWKTGTYPVPFGPVDPVLLSKKIGKLAKLDKDTPPWWHPGNKPVTRFQRRVARMQEYLAGDPKEIMPITFVGECGYDFILSNCGLDLFAPEAPEDEFDLCRFYSFRRTGRGNLGIPGYLDGRKVLTFAVDAPTGPGQVFTTPAAFDSISVCGVHPLSKLGCLKADRTGGDPSRLTEWRQAGYVSFDYTNYLAVAGNLRRWQLEGSVYLAMMTELPRIVANIWMEKKAGWAGASAYATKWGAAEFAEIFETRIETSLPAGMELKVADGPDVRISNRGMRIPALRGPAAGNGPLMDQMLNAIIRGRAGNPVFTDSMRPGGEE